MAYFHAHRSLVNDYFKGRLVKTAYCDHELAAAPVAIPRFFRLPTDNESVRMFADGSKTVDGRLDVGDVKKIREGDGVIFGSVRLIVAQTMIFESFRQMLENVGWTRVWPEAECFEQALEQQMRPKQNTEENAT